MDFELSDIDNDTMTRPLLPRRVLEYEGPLSHYIQGISPSLDIQENAQAASRIQAIRGSVTSPAFSSPFTLGNDYNDGQPPFSREIKDQTLQQKRAKRARTRKNYVYSAPSIQESRHRVGLDGIVPFHKEML